MGGTGEGDQAPPSLLRALLPPRVHIRELFGSPDLTSSLFAAEVAVVARAVTARQLEFAAGRDCAHRALARLGVPQTSLLPGADRAPRWPSGVRGSLTHCTGYAAAAVCRIGAVASVGIDAEPDAPLPLGVLAEVASVGEQAALRKLPPGPSWDRLLFSAKESVYKAWFPLTGRWLDFGDAVVDISSSGRWRAQVLVQSPLRELVGRFAVGQGLLVTATAVPRKSLDRS